MVSWPISRWLIDASSSLCSTSIGSSIVTMCTALVAFRYPIIAASVVVLPDPVGPVTRISPRCSSASAFIDSGSPISSKLGPPKRSFRRTIEIEPRCRKTFARKRPTLATE